jgi:hypothetical protein
LTALHGVVILPKSCTPHKNSFYKRISTMLASRLVKLMVVALVSLVPSAANATFIIDTFNSASNNYKINVGQSNELDVVRTHSAGFSHTGTSFSFVSAGGADFLNIGYSFSGDTIGNVGLPSGLELRFNSVTGATWGAQATWFDGENFSGNILGSAFAPSVSPGSNIFANITAPNLSLAKSVRFNFFNFGSAAGDGFNLSNVTATPEPTTLVLFGAVTGIGLIARRRAKKQLVAA